MQLLEQLILLENQRRAQQEITYVIKSINKIYNEWKKVKRRTNTMDIVTNSVNKISSINPVMVHYIHKAAKAKLVIIIMRCLDLPIWKGIETKERIWKKLHPLIAKLQNERVNTGTNATLKDVIMTRLSAAISYETTKGEVFTAYEKVLPSDYIRFLFGSSPPTKTYRMQSLMLPADFDTLVDTLRINQNKAMKKYSQL